MGQRWCPGRRRQGDARDASPDVHGHGARVFAGPRRCCEYGRQIERQQAVNAGLKARNDALAAEVNDLKQAFDAIEERARSELGMVKRDEFFFMLQDRDGAPPPAVSPGSTAAPDPGRGKAAPAAARPAAGVQSMADGSSR